MRDLKSDLQYLKKSCLGTDKIIFERSNTMAVSLKLVKTKGEEAELDKDGNPVLYASGEKKGQPKTTTVDGFAYAFVKDGEEKMAAMLPTFKGKIVKTEEEALPLLKEYIAQAGRREQGVENQLCQADNCGNLTSNVLVTWVGNVVLCNEHMTTEEVVKHLEIPEGFTLSLSESPIPLSKVK